MVGLQFLYDLSDRQVEEAASYNLLCKWFLGYAVHVLDKTAIAARVDLPPSTGHSGHARFLVKVHHTSSLSD